MRKTNPISDSGTRSRAGTPNLPRAGACKTKPIPGEPMGPPEPIVQNEPNFRWGRAGRGPRDVGHGATVQNEANVRPRRGRVQWRHEYRRLSF
jgi:hypothetical protein